MRTSKSITRLLLTITFLTTALNAHAQEENMETLFDLNHILAYVVAALLIGFFCLVFHNRLIIFREQDDRLRSHTQNTQLSMIMHNNKLRVWIFNVQERMYNLISDDGTVRESFTPLDFSHFYDRDDFDKLRKHIASMTLGNARHVNLQVRTAPFSPSFGSSRSAAHVMKVSIRPYETDTNGLPLSIIGLERDITDEMEQHENVDKLMMRFQTLFNSSVIDMVYYDKDGYLTDINDKACQSFGIKSRGALLRKRPNITDIEPFKNINIHTFAGYQLSAMAQRGSFRMAAEKTSGRDATELGEAKDNEMYYDIVINPIRNEQGELTGLYTAGRDITEMVEAFHRQKESTRKLRQATKDIEEYISNINYALQISQVRLMNYYPDTHVLEISTDLNSTQFQLTQVRCVGLIAIPFRRRAKGLLRRMDRRDNSSIEVTLQSVLRDEKGRKVWLSFSVIPMLKSDGTVSHYFGMCRNTTEWMATQQLLQEETEKAQETERLKDSFLLNMSYEIRTPLNTVLGFAQMFAQEHDPADEPLFAEEIKRNANELLALVNESLYLSRLDAHMIEMRPVDTDFSVIFDSYCRVGWKDVAPGINTIIENPYEHLIVTLDEQSIGQVIQRICSNAASMTKEGFVRSKYEYRQGELIIKIEDTSAGIDDKTLPHVFDRFATDSMGRQCGNGLNLPIAKELVEQMGGTIDFQSEEGKGNTVWINIPCEAKVMETVNIER